MDDWSVVAQNAAILLVDDSPDVLAGLNAILSQRYNQLATATSGEEALDIMGRRHVDLVITDLSMPGIDGLELLSKIGEGWPGVIVIVITGFGSIETAVEAMKRGAYHYIAKPFRAEEILIIVDHALKRLSLEKELDSLRRQLAEGKSFEGMVAQSKKMIEVFEFVRKVAPTDAPVLIRGESGTGKELVARAIHGESTRSTEQFLGINAAALPEQLLEAELFGYKRGAFTGATQEKEGLLTSARGGTVFLDEISRMPGSCQAKLLRAIEEREVLPVGGLKAQDIDVRFISATNADELRAIRDDLYYRLSVMEVQVPPLRDRLEDVPLLATHFVERYAFQFGKKPRRLTAEAVEALTRYEWPGNVRELENVIQRAVVMSAGEEISADDVWVRTSRSGEPIAAGLPLGPYNVAKEQALSAFQRRYVRMLLDQSDGNITKAARTAGITRASLYGIMKKLGFDKD
jgi:DNA-binding NtrC family response regulator